MDNKIKFAPPFPTSHIHQSAIRQIEEMNLWERRLFLAKEPQKSSYPHFLYKFKSLRSGKDDARIKQLRDILVESRLWLSSPRKFNDPFDMTARVIFEGTTQEIRDRFKTLIANISGKGWKERRALLEQMMSKPRDEWKKSIEQIHSKHHEQVGVFSFASDPRSIIMWSHYGDQHSGICLQFQIARDPGVFLNALRVEYAQAYPIFNWAKESAAQLDGSLLRKYKEWEYEGERRIVLAGGAEAYVPFNPSALTGIIFGCQPSIELARIVREILIERGSKGYSDLKIYRAERHESRYKLVLRREK